MSQTAQRVERDEPQPARLVARNGAEALLQLFAAQGAEYLFFNPGTDTAPIIEALVALARDGRPAPEPVPCLFENVALAAAHAYFLLTRRPQVVLVHVDVGTQNLGGMVHNAQRGHAGVVIVAGRAPYTIAGTGSAPGGRDRSIQWQQDEPDQIGIVRNYVKWSHELGRSDTLQQLVPRAFQVAAAEPSGPVYMTVAREVLMEPLGELAVDALTPVPETPAADPAAVDTLARWLAEAERPIAIAGELGRHPAAVGELVRLAELVGLPVSSIRGPLNFPPTHSLALGEGHQQLKEADLVLLLDADVPWVPSVAQPPSGARIVQIDLDPVHQSIPYWGFPVHLSIQADTRKALPQLHAALEQLATPSRRAAWSARAASFAKAQQVRLEQQRARLEAARPERPIAADWAARALAEVLPDDAIVVEEVTTSGGPVRRPPRQHAARRAPDVGRPGPGVRRPAAAWAPSSRRPIGRSWCSAAMARSSSGRRLPRCAPPTRWAPPS